MKNILVTGVGGRSVGSGIVHALHRSASAAKGQWNVIGADADPFSWGLYITPQSLILPLASAPTYLSAVLQAVEKYDIHAIVPGTEIETEKLIAHRTELPVPLIANDAALIPLMMDKRASEIKIKELGLACIPSYTLARSAQAAREFGFPLIAKPSVGTGGSRGLALIFNQEELDAYLEKADPATRPMIQPYLGTPDEEYTVGVLSHSDGQLIDTIIMRRKLMGLSLLQSREANGKRAAISTGYSQGFFVKDEAVQSYCENLARMLGSRGPLNIQLRRHGDTLYVMEIHARFSGTTPMRADVGFNEPDLLLRDALFGERFGRLPMQTDVAVTRAFEHVVVPISQMRTP